MVTNTLRQLNLFALRITNEDHLAISNACRMCVICKGHRLLTIDMVDCVKKIEIVCEGLSNFLAALIAISLLTSDAGSYQSIFFEL